MDMLNAVKSVLADVLSISPSSESEFCCDYLNLVCNLLSDGPVCAAAA